MCACFLCLTKKAPEGSLCNAVTMINLRINFAHVRAWQCMSHCARAVHAVWPRNVFNAALYGVAHPVYDSWINT